MTVINSLGVNSLSIRGAGTDFHRLSRIYESLAEANADIGGGYVVTPGVVDLVLIKGVGVAYYDSATSTFKSASSEDELDIDNLVALTGVAENVTNLGSFTGSTIADNQTIKQALQALETTLEAVDIDTNDMATLVGLAENINNLGTFTGTTINDAVSIKAALQALETAVELRATSATVTEIDGNADALISLTGLAEGSTNLGSFSGSLLSNDITIKAALQTLETLLEDTDGNANSLISLTGVAENATTLGSFAGSLLGDSLTIHAALETLETLVQTNINSIAGILDGATFTGAILGAQLGNIIPFYFDNQAAFGSASTYHGAIAHSHADGAMYYAHGGSWLKLAEDDEVRALLGVSAGDANLGTFSGSTIADSVSVKTALQALETLLEDTDGNSDSLISLTGVSENVTHLGTFSGGTISDSSTIKAALQDLESGVELRATLASPALTGVPTAPNAAASTNNNQIATTSFVANAVANLVDGAPGAIDTLNELAAALGDDANFSTTVTNLINANETHIDNMATLTGAAKDAVNLGTFSGSTIADSVTIKAALQALETKAEANTSSIATTQADVDQNESDADAAIALKFDKAGGTLTGNVTVSKSFPDFQLRANDEKRLIFADAGGAGTAALKHTSSTLDFFVGGIASGNKEMSLGTDGLDVTALKIDGTAITATATELNYVDGVSSAIQTQLDSKLAISGAAAALHLDDLLTAVGIASEGLHLGTFTGSTISDNQTVKAAIQALETAVENRATSIELLAVQSDVDQNESDADAAIALRATIDSPAFTGQHITHTAGNTLPTTHKIIGGFPDFILQTNQGDFATHQNEGRLLWHDAGAGGVGSIKMGLKDTEPMRFFTGGITASDEQMRINANGRVGIGTTDPAALFHVEGSIIAKADFPDVALRSGGERRVLFADAGGSAEGGIKFASNTFKIFAGGGIASGNEAIACNGTTIETKDDLVQNPGSSVTPAENGELVVEATNNTTLTFKLKGSDGTVRSGTITLS